MASQPTKGNAPKKGASQKGASAGSGKTPAKGAAKNVSGGKAAEVEAKPKGVSASVIAPVMFAFFVMGFVDLIGTAGNHVKPEFHLTDSQTNLLTSMVFFWFLIFSVPASILMNKIGRKRTVLLSILITLFAMLLPILAYTLISAPDPENPPTARLVVLVIGFALLGIGNCFMQVSLNPLLGSFVSGKQLASTLTLGQFVKAFASLFAPFIATWAADTFDKWWLLFVIYFVVGVIGFILLQIDKIEEPAPDAGTVTVGQCFKLLGNPVVLLCFIGIVCHVGIDAGINGQAPRILREHLETVISESTANNSTMVYFGGRLVGCLLGGILLSKLGNKLGLRICGCLLIISAALYGVFTSIAVNPPVAVFYIATALIGFANSNVFSLFLSQALITEPDRQNQVSGLMMMGLIGGAIFPPIMGAAADAMGQLGSILVVSVGCIYVLVVALLFDQVLVRKTGKAAARA